MQQVDAKQAKEKLSELLELVQQGEEVIITKNDQPFAKLAPIAPPKRRQFGSAKGLIQMASDFDETPEGFEEYM